MATSNRSHTDSVVYLCTVAVRGRSREKINFSWISQAANEFCSGVRHCVAKKLNMC